MDCKIIGQFKLDSDEKQIIEFVKSRKNTIEILEALKPVLDSHFPKSELSLELCDDLAWTTETKLLLNIHTGYEMFFNCLLAHFKDIYAEIEHIIGDGENTVVLFPNLDDERFDRMGNDGAINLLARTAYFNSHNNGIIQREVGFRKIPEAQRKKEIIEYCNSHGSPNISDIVFDLRLELFDVDDAIAELEEEGIVLDVQY